MFVWIMLIVLCVLVIYCVIKHILYRTEMKHATNQLENIIQNISSNELIQTKTNQEITKQLLAKINQLIHLYKMDQQKKEKYEKELKQEITNISHDLRTPLTSLKGFADILKDPSLTEEERQASLEIIQKKINHLTQIVDLFYDLSQINSADHHFSFEAVDLNQMVVEVMLLYFHDFEKKQITVNMNEKSDIVIYMNKKAGQRIITNLIENAMYYSKSHVDIFIEDYQDYAVLTMINDVEMNDFSNLNHVFERSFRIDESRTENRLGLGLHIVKQLIEQQGGKITADVMDNKFKLRVFFKNKKLY